ncbi:DNA replication complex subunit Gins51 [Halorussus sp. AFM4]|uniref:DNA replication complex subunit Gins51 n=1 Tax=Halorussus sp. AFM4 TaxID=3421651 RepID=UPI003EBAE200
MNLDELRTVQSKERSKDSLQHLRESFYADVADYIADLKDQRERAAERADSPFDDPEVERLTDEINTAEDVVEAIYERRVGKIVKRASLAAAGMPADEDGLTSEEQELFAELVDRIEENKQDVLDVLAGEADDPAGSTPTPTPADAGEAAEPSSDAADATPGEASAPDPGEPPAASADSTSGDAAGGDVSAADVMDGDGATDAGSESTTPDTGASADDDTRPAAAEATAVADGPDTDQSSEAGDETSPSPSESDADADSGDPTAGLDERTTIRITDDVGEIFGVDERTYDLESEDVVTLPEANAEPLVERGAAEKLE